MQLKKLILILLVCLSFILSSGEAFSQSRKDLAKEHYQKGMGYYKQTKYKEAQEEFRLALSLSPDTADKAPVGGKTEKKKQKAAKTTVSPEKQAKPSGYVIGEEDALYISVWQNKDLDQEVTVRPDGMISFPLVGEVPASGLSITEFKEQLTNKLKEYIKYPDVSISVRKLGGKKVILLGEVSAPGVYAVSGKSTLLEVVAMAGGFSRDAVLSSVILIRGGFNDPKGSRLNLNRAILKADMSQNLVLLPEDIIYVPKKFIANVNYFVSQTVGPIMQGSSPYQMYQKK